MNEFDKEKNIDTYVVEDSVDINKLKNENRRKYRELYEQLDNLAKGKIWPFNTINKDALKKLQSSENYYEALKTGFFIEEYTNKIQYLGMDEETVNSIKRDIKKVSDGETNKYDDLLFWLNLYYRKTYPRPKEMLKIMIFALAGAVLIGIFLTIGVFTHKAIFFLICPIILFIFVLGTFILFRKENIEKPLK